MPRGDAKRTVRELARLALDASHDARRAGVTRVGIPVDASLIGGSALAWLQSQGCAVKTYWRDRDRGHEMAGLGAAELLTDGEGMNLGALFEELKRRLARAPRGVRYYGAIRFSPTRRADPSWEPFGTHRFILPRIELIGRSRQYCLVCNLGRQGEAGARPDDVLAEIEALQFVPADDLSHWSSPESRRDIPDKAAWSRIVKRALSAIATDEIEKVVLARETQFAFRNPPDPLALLGRLAGRVGSGRAEARPYLMSAGVRDALARDHLERAYHFCFQVSPSDAFLGVSPELLYRRRGLKITSEAIAGTRRRGFSIEEDVRLGRDLLEDEKERREHQCVVGAAEEALKPLCRSLAVGPDVALLKLWNCQHLFRRIKGTLIEKDDAGIVVALHPTPAVGGYPAANALRWVERLEPFDRGWYAGPVGWVARDAAEFVVGIRSGRISKDSVSAYSGAGIVAGSKPDSEWDEIEQKMSGFLAALAGSGAEHE